MTHFRILHISDLHFGKIINHLNRHEAYLDLLKGKKSDVNWKELAKNPKIVFHPTTYADYARLRLVKFCERYQEDYDVGLVTGDLAATGRDEDLLPALGYFCRSTRAGFVQRDQDNTLSAIKREFFVIPGNHDRYTNWYPMPGSRNFDRIFSGLYPGGEVYSFTRTKMDYSIGIVFGDFSIKNIQHVGAHQTALYGNGIAYEYIIEKMEKETKRLRKAYSPIFIVWAMHFAPFECNEDLKLRRYQDVLQSVEENEIGLILCGHLHEKKLMKSNNCVIYCAGSVMCTDSIDNHFAHIVDIRVDDNYQRRIKRENYILRRSSGTYLKESED